MEPKDIGTDYQSHRCCLLQGICSPVIIWEHKVIVIPLESMFVEMCELVGPTMHAAITREPQTLPISTNTLVTPLLVSLLFGEKQSWALDTIADVEFMLGKYACKEFDQGTYAIILPPLHFKLVTT